MDPTDHPRARASGLVRGVAAVPAVQPLRRPPGDRLIGGVAVGVAEHLDVSSLLVRIGFAVLTAVGGFGMVVYLVLWILVPAGVASRPDRTGETAPAALATTRAGRGHLRGPVRRIRDGDVGQLVAAVAVGLGLLLLFGGPPRGVPRQLWWPMLIAVAGVALLWWQADAAERARWLGDPSEGVGQAGRRWLSAARVCGGALLMVTALFAYAAGQGSPSGLVELVFFTVVVVVGLVLVAGPFVLRLLRQLDAERHQRQLQQQQADVAAHLHDSVLQTLALIQRQADDPRMVTALARAQERDLRTWLFAPSSSRQGTLHTALDEVAAEVERMHGVPVEVVVVGDRSLDDRGHALVRAAREAVANAARHSGAATVDVYAESGPEGLEVFVRDRGCGFDQSAVPLDRMGLAGSIVGRMKRHGGTARVRSAPGAGTEVALHLPDALAPAAPDPAAPDPAAPDPAAPDPVAPNPAAPDPAAPDPAVRRGALRVASGPDGAALTTPAAEERP
ncbi:MAG: ATP-binding protein [Angustibacter sp.]